MNNIFLNMGDILDGNDIFFQKLTFYEFILVTIARKELSVIELSVLVC